MDGFQALKRQLLPILKGLPFIIIVFVVFLFIAKRIVMYTPNTYQTIARIKLDDQKYGFSNNALYKDFDVFTTENKIQAEAEILKSPLLVQKALDSVDFNISIYRKGQMKNTLLYDDSPLLIEYSITNPKFYDKELEIQVLDDLNYIVHYQEYENTITIDGTFESITMLDGVALSIKKNDALLASRDLQLAGDYLFKIFSKDELLRDVSERLDIQAVDKEIAVLRVVFKDQHPKKAADFANAICRTYIEDYVNTKSKAAFQTVDFIDQRLATVSNDLVKAEIALEDYKQRNNVVNTRQETETGLRQISSLQVSLINLEMNEKAILELEEYIAKGDYFDETAINFGFGDLLMTELVKKLKLWQDEKEDLKIKYTEESDEVQAVNRKIAQLKEYIKEAIKRNKVEIITKREEIQKSVELASTQFEGLPQREKELRRLERNFSLQEQVYDFLSQKKIEASIAANAQLSFHRIIQPASVPKKPVAPNKTLITFVAGLLGLIIGISAIYLKQILAGKVTTRQELEKLTDLPIAGVVSQLMESKEYRALQRSLVLRNTLDKGSVIAVTSSLNQEGKSTMAENLSKAFQFEGYSVALVTCTEGFGQTFDGDNKSSFLPIELSLESITKFENQIAQLKEKFDLVIVDAPSATISVDAISIMKLADLSLYMVRVGKSGKHQVVNASLINEEYDLSKVQLVLNGVHKATNFSGHFVGTKYQENRAYGLIPVIKSYLKVYLK